MNRQEILSAGFLLVRAVPRPSFVSQDLMPATVISASNCICPQFPGPYAIRWVTATDEERASRLSAAGLEPREHAAAIEWATEAFDKAFGWPGVFRTLDDAKSAKMRFLAEGEDVRIIGLGMPAQFKEEFVADAMPPVSPPGFAPNGESGYLESLRSGTVLPGGGRSLGFELLNLQLGILEDSWLCNGLEQHCATALQIRPSTTGLLGTLEEAVRCLAAISAEKVASEPGAWYPFMIVEYPSPTKSRAA